ncbi:MAG TPA: CHC2 zinc finger domain-containing protein, partial [Nitrosopumilaceae archaeon]|nr:CHC2 zinc finger domain-containing protein [Nitrosopumilaceae archaeon]
KNGVEYTGRCPFHSDNTPSFTLSQKSGKWLHHCFGCDKSGSVLDFVMGFDKVGFGPAIKTIQTELGNDWQENKKLVDSTFQPVIKNETKKLVIPLEKYYPLEQALSLSKEGKAWLKSRGIEYETAKKLHVGFRKNIGNLCPSNSIQLVDQGWIAFPYIENGQVAGIKYRSIIQKIFVHQPGMKTTLFGMEY